MVVVPAYFSYKRKEEKVKNLTTAHSNALEIYPPTDAVARLLMIDVIFQRQ